MKQKDDMSKTDEKNLKMPKRERLSQQVTVRMPPSLWQQLATLAVEQGRSVNRQIVFMLEKAVRMEDNIDITRW